MGDFNKSIEVTSAMATLETLEDAVAKNAAGHGELRKRADDVYQARVEQLAKANDVSISEAHGLAINDEIASRAYAVSQDLAAKQEHAIEAGGQIAAFVE